MKIKKMSNSKLTQERLKHLLHYDPETGVFTWLRKSCSKVLPGRRAGSLHTQGYRQVKLEGEVLLEHRVATLYMTGAWPIHQVDHRDGNRTNNAWENLRPATQEQQTQNSCRRRDNTSGFQGVGWFKPKGLWRARIRLKKREHHLGYFNTPEEAHQAYLTAKAQLHTFQPTPRPQ